MKMRFHVLRIYETDFDYNNEQDDPLQSFATACKTLRDNLDAEIARAKLVESAVIHTEEC